VGPGGYGYPQGPSEYGRTTVLCLKLVEIGGNWIGNDVVLAFIFL